MRIKLPSINIKTSAAVAVSASAIASGVNAAQPESTLIFDEASSAKSNHRGIEKGDEENFSFQSRVELIRDKPEFTKENESRFEELALLEALDEITKEEALELTKLTDIRRRLFDQDDGEKLLTWIKKQRAFVKVLAAVEEYVELETTASR